MIVTRMQVLEPIDNINRLLANLPSEELQVFLERCEIVRLQTQARLNIAGQKIDYIYFPINSLISLMLTVDGKSIETGLIGNEGMLGTAVFLGAEEAACGAFVQISGDAYRISTADFLDVLAESESLRILLSRYVLVLIERLSISVGCHHFHTTEKRLAYLLLIIQKSVNSNCFSITQTIISNLLGVRRSSISEAAGSLHDKNIIQYSRGRVHIIDVLGLKRESCSCYKAVQKSYQWINC